MFAYLRDKLSSVCFRFDFSVHLFLDLCFFLLKHFRVWLHLVYVVSSLLLDRSS
jgi:hypothetical protein